MSELSVDFQAVKLDITQSISQIYRALADFGFQHMDNEVFLQLDQLGMVGYKPMTEAYGCMHVLDQTGLYVAGRALSSEERDFAVSSLDDLKQNLEEARPQLTSFLQAIQAYSELIDLPEFADDDSSWEAGLIAASSPTAARSAQELGSPASSHSGTTSMMAPSYQVWSSPGGKNGCVESPSGQKLGFSRR